MEFNLIQWIAIGSAIGLGIFNSYFTVKRWTNKGNNPFPCKEHSEELKEQGKKIVKIETKIESIEKFLEKLNRR